MTSRKHPTQRSHTERIAWLLEHLWEGNQSKMASAVGCSQSLLSRVLAGQQAPGRQLLERIAQVPRINSAWLLSGRGAALFPEPDLDGLPISRVLLPGPPADYPEQWLSVRHPVPRAFHAAGRYWLYVGSDFPIAPSKSAKVDVGDLILMETDFDEISRDSWVDRTLAVVLFWNDDEPIYRLCELTHKEPMGEILANTFEDEGQVIIRTTVDKYPDGTSLRRTSFMRADPGAQTQSSNETPKNLREIQWNDVVSYGILLIRDFVILV
jgi:transcriptional regulator with XRE-family HTH domain